MAGEDGADSEFGGKADNGKSGGFNADFALALAFPATAKGKAFRPTKIFGIVVGNECNLAVVGRRERGGARMGMRVQDFCFSGFLAPTRQQRPALQRARARVPDQNHSPPVTYFWAAAQLRRESPAPFRSRPPMTKESQRTMEMMIKSSAPGARWDGGKRLTREWKKGMVENSEI